MRTLLVLSLALIPLAGCVGDGPDDAADDLGAESGLVPGLYDSHPMYGFPTNGLLPQAEGNVTRHVAADGTVHWYRPAGKPLPDAISGLSDVAHVEGTSTGGGIAVFGPLAFIGQRTQGPLQVIDISDPSAPVVVGEADGAPVRDADPILFPDGRLVVISTAGGGDQFATDVTDPTNPRLIATFGTDHGNHNIAVVPGTPIVYNSGSGGVIDIVDYADPENPVAVGTFENGNGCHDITFYIDTSAELYRAYCAGYPQTEIWDITDPKAPTMVIEIPYPGIDKGLPIVGESSPLPDVQVTDPVLGQTVGSEFPLSFSHLAIVNHDATVLIVGDETGGGAINGCDVYADAGGQTVSGPLGNLWFYDISDEADPVLRGHMSPSFTDAVGVPSVPDPAGLPFSALDAVGSCTAHFGRLVEDTGFLVMGFYAAGVVLVDFTDLSNPVIVDRLDAGGSIWDVWYQDGYLFTGDMSRGMDILEVV